MDRVNIQFMDHRTILTFVGQVHVEAGAVVHLFDYDFALEERQIEFLVEEPVRDTDQSGPVHQQNRATLAVELPSTPQGDTLVVGSGTVKNCGKQGGAYEGTIWLETHEPALACTSSLFTC